MAPNKSDRLLPLRDVIYVTSFSAPTIYRMIAAGDFPRPVKIGRTSRWSANEVQNWVEVQKATSASA